MKGETVSRQQGRLAIRASRVRIAGLSLALLALAGCHASGEDSGRSDRDAIRLRLVNEGASPLDCRLRFGHWIDRDLGTIAGGEGIEFPVSQQGSDGAFYVLRDDGNRRMMIETIECWRDQQWQASFAQVDFAPARARRPEAMVAACALPPQGGRVVCQDVRIEE